MVITMQERLEPIVVDEPERTAEEVAELVVPLSANAAQVFKFICQLDDALDDKANNCKYASILHTVSYRDRGTIITMLAPPAVLAKLPERLANMPEVQKVHEEPLADTFPVLPNKPGILSKSGLNLTKRIYISLQ